MNNQQEWLELAHQDAQVCPYDAAILDLVLQIIDEKDYRGLFTILSNYDGLVKAIGDRVDQIYNVDRTLPYWCYCYGIEQ